MTAHYLDPSAWVKRYFEEVGSDAVATVSVVSADADLLAASSAEGLEAFNPETRSP